MASDVILEIGANTKKAAKSIESLRSGAVKAFGAIAAAAAAAFAGKKIIDGIKNVTDSANIQANAINKLNTSLKLAGDFSEESSRGMQDFASQLQSVTTIGDEATLEMLALSKAFGTTNEESKDLVTAAADLSAALGIPIEQAVRNLGKTKGGLAGELGELVPQLRGVSAEALKSGEAIKIVADRFKGAAAAAKGTFSGAITSASNAFGDLKEEIGFVITQNPVLRKFISSIEKLFVSFGNAVKENRGFLTDFVSEGVIYAVKAFGTFIKIISDSKTILEFLIDSLATAAQGAVLFGQGVDTIAAAWKALTTGDLQGAFDDLAINIARGNESLANLQAFKNKDLGPVIEGISDKISESVDTLIKDLEKAKKKGLIGLDAKTENEITITGERSFLQKTQKFLEGFEQSGVTLANAAVSAFQTGGRAGAQSFGATAATAAATVLGAGPFASTIGEIFKLLTTEGAVNLINSVIDNIPQITETFSENIPLVALALAETVASPKFNIRFANAFIDGLTKGIDKAAEEFSGKFKETFNVLIPNLFNKLNLELDKLGTNTDVAFENAVNKFDSKWEEFTTSLNDDFLEVRNTVTQEAKVAADTFFAFLGKSFSDFFSEDFWENFGIKIREQLVRSANDFVNEIERTFTTNIPNIWENFKAESDAAWVDFKSQAQEFFNVFNGEWIKIRDDILGTFNDIGNFFLRIGNFFENIAKGLGKIGGDLTGGVGGGVKEFFGLANGGTVPAGFPNDTFPARLTSGETVVTKDTTKDLENFLSRQGNVEALLMQIVNLLSKPTQVSSSVNVNGQALADIILELNRQNARIA